MPRHAPNLIGQQFSLLTVMSRQENDIRGNSKWLCRCSCGKEKISRACDLLRGSVKSCGCARYPKPLEVTGQKFGRLRALSKSQDGPTNYHWNCLCDCGKEHKAASHHLLNGRIRSCGCLTKDVRALQRGSKGANWRGGVTTQNMLVRRSEKYKNWRTQVFVRDSFLCQECGAGGELHAHHIKSFAAFPESRFELSNGKTLCVPCHKKTPDFGGRGKKNKEATC